MTSKQRPWIKRLACPGYKAWGSLSTILYGMPGEDFEFDRYISGGCVRNFFSEPDIACRQCQWSGMRNDYDHFYPDLYANELETEFEKKILVIPEITIELEAPAEQLFKYSKGRLDSHTL